MRLVRSLLGTKTYKICLVVVKIDPQSSNTVNGTPSRSQYVTRSEKFNTLSLALVYEEGGLPRPFFANSRSVSRAAERSDTPSPA